MMKFSVVIQHNHWLFSSHLFVGETI